VLDPGPGGALQAGDLVVGIVRRPDPVPCPSCAVGEWDMCRNGQYTERGIKEIDGSTTRASARSRPVGSDARQGVASHPAWQSPALDGVLVACPGERTGIEQVDRVVHDDQQQQEDQGSPQSR